MIARLLSLPIHRPKSCLLVALLLTATSLFGISRFRADTSFENLLPSDDPAAGAMVKTLNDFSAVDEMLVLVTMPEGQAADVAPLTQFAERFTSSLDRGLVASVTYRVDDQARMFFQNVVAPAGLFYLDDQSFAAARQRLTRPEMDRVLKQNAAMLAAPGPAAGALAATLLQDPLHLHDFLMKQLAASMPVQIGDGSGLLLSKDRKSLLIRIAGKRPVSDLDYSHRMTDAVHAAITTARPGNLTVDVSGGYAIAAASESAIRHDMTSGITGSVILLQLLFIVAYRRPIRFFLLAFLPVGLGIVWGFGARALFGTSLSPTAAVVGGVLAGLGIDYTIQYLSNYQSRRGDGATPHTAGGATSTAMGGTILTAWATSVIGFCVVGGSTIAALRDFALVGSLGLLGALLATFLVLPALLMVTDRDTTASRLRFDVYPLLLAIAQRRRLAAGVVGLALVASMIVVAWPGARIAMESDLTVMHPRPNPPLDAEATIARVMGVQPDAILVHLSARTDEQLVHLSLQVRRALDAKAVHDAGISGSFGLANLLPDPLEAKKRAGQITDADAQKVVVDFNAAVAASDFDSATYVPYSGFLKVLLTRKQAPGVEALRAYPELAKSMMSRAMLNGSDDGQRESITLLFTNRSLDNRADRAAAVGAAREALMSIDGATLTGLSVVGLDAEAIVYRQVPRMLLISAIIIAAALLIHFRNVGDTVLAFAPTLFSLLVLAAAARVSGQSLNMMNLLVIPLLMGIDTDYGIFLIGLTRHAAHDRTVTGIELLRVARSGTPGRGGDADAEDTALSTRPCHPEARNPETRHPEKRERDWRDRSARTLAACFYALGISAASAALGFGSLIFTSVPAIRSLGWAMGVGVAICFIATLLFRVPMLLNAGGTSPDVD